MLRSCPVATFQATARPAVRGLATASGPGPG